MSMNENQQTLARTEDDLVITEPTAIDLSIDQSDNYTKSGQAANELYKVFIGGLVGATLGAIAGALLIKGATQKINQTVKNAGDTVKNASGNLNQTIKGIGDAIVTVAGGVNDTVKDVGDSVKDTTTGINETVKNTVDVLKGTASNMNQTVKTTVDTVKTAATDVSDSVRGSAKTVTENDVASYSESVNVPNNQTTYILVPVDNQKK